MTNRLFRAFGASLIVLSALATAIPANAATMPWTWTDISDQLTIRQNRPIWAMAYASPFWYYTDGQDLWNGGQVYRFDGQTQVNITTDVRSAGISRVDDIVTDGANVIFFQDIVRLDNTVQAVMYRSGSYRSVTNTLRSSLDSNEGIRSIVGRNGTWLMVSTRARLVKFNEDISSYTRLTAPSSMRQLGTSYTSLLANKDNHLASIWIAPLGSKFILAVDPEYIVNGRATEFYLFDGTTFSFVYPPAGLDRVFAAAFSPSEALYIASTSDHGGSEGVMYTFNGATWQKISNGQWFCYRPGYCNTPSTFSNMSNFSATWDGSRWMVVSEKNLFSINNNSLENLGQTRDYFVTASSNGSGTIYLGGAVSNLGNTQPSYPLTAKLVKAVVGGATQTNTTNNTANTTNQSAYGINSWTWIDPSQNYIRRDQNLNFNVGAQSAKGIKKIEIVINGATAKTCDLNGSTSNQNCSFSIWGGTYGLGTTIAVNAKVTDNKGASAWTALSYLTVTEVVNASSNTNTNTNNTVTNNFGLSAWQWLEPSGTTIKNSQSMTFYVGAQHANGLNRMELYVNGALRRTCSLSTTSANQTCSVTINGSEYSAGTAIAMNAKVVGTAGEYQQLWTPLITLNVANADGTVTTPTTQSASAPTTWIWVIPPGTNLLTSPASYHVGAWDGENGIRRIEMWVNGTVKRVCSFPDVKTNVECSWDILLGDYPSGSEVFVNAKVEDAAGNIAWAQSQSWRVETNSVTTSQYVPNMALYLFNLYKKQ